MMEVVCRCFPPSGCSRRKPAAISGSVGTGSFFPRPRPVLPPPLAAGVTCFLFALAGIPATGLFAANAACCDGRFLETFGTAARCFAGRSANSRIAR